MKTGIILLYFSILAFSHSSFAESCMIDDAIIFPPALITTAPTSCLSYTTKSLVEDKKHSLFIEASPLEANFLVTGEGLSNPALIYAMQLVSEENPSITPEELALRVIEEANKK